jgi:hypothetical protein
MNENIGREIANISVPVFCLLSRNILKEKIVKDAISRKTVL